MVVTAKSEALVIGPVDSASEGIYEAITLARSHCECAKESPVSVTDLDPIVDRVPIRDGGFEEAVAHSLRFVLAASRNGDTIRSGSQYTT